MSFVRVFVGRKSNQVRGVYTQDVPFEDGQIAYPLDEEVDVVDLGFAMPHDWKDLEGNPCSPAKHFHQRLERDHSDMPKIHDAPCSMQALEAQIREKGVKSVPGVVRGWLAFALPPDRVEALGLATSYPISVYKAAEALRRRMDPGGGSRRLILERVAQELSDKRQAQWLALRHTRAKARFADPKPRQEGEGTDGPA